MHRAAALAFACLVPGCIVADDDECDPGPDVFADGPIAFLPPPGATWQWQLSDLPVDTSVCAAVYDVDLFTTSEDEIRALRDSGRAVICYFSAGSFESGRPDADSFPQEVKGEPLDPPFEDELWLDVRSQAVRDIMQARLDVAMNKGCHAVEPDNVDGYANTSGFDLSGADQIDFNLFLASEAHARGLSVGLKNDVDQLADLVDSFDWALNEECFFFEECDLYADTFISQEKAVFHAEYIESVDEDQLSDVCRETEELGLSTIMKNLELDAFRLTCADQ